MYFIMNIYNEVIGKIKIIIKNVEIFKILFLKSFNTIPHCFLFNVMLKIFSYMVYAAL